MIDILLQKRYIPMLCGCVILVDNTFKKQKKYVGFNGKIKLLFILFIRWQSNTRNNKPLDRDVMVQ